MVTGQMKLTNALMKNQHTNISSLSLGNTITLIGVNY